MGEMRWGGARGGAGFGGDDVGMGSGGATCPSKRCPPPCAPKSLGHPKAGWGMEECWMGPKG